MRLLSCAQRISKLCETPVTSAMITDVPGYTWGIVPAFAHSGVKYFSIGPNGGDRIGHTIAAWGDKPFWWIGPNGKDKVLVWMTGTGYYRVFSSADNLLQYLGSLEEKGYPYDFVQVRHCLGDNGAPDVNFADTVKQWNDTHAYPKLVIATTDEMFRDFEQRYGDKLPTAQGDFTPYWEDGAASSALETAMNRASADRLTQAETLFAMFNPQAYPAAGFLSGLAQRHPLRRTHLGRAQQHQPARRAVRQEPVGHQAAVRGGCGRAVAQAAGRRQRQPRRRRRASGGQRAGHRRRQHDGLQLSLDAGCRAEGTVQGRRRRQHASGGRGQRFRPSD